MNEEIEEVVQNDSSSPPDMTTVIESIQTLTETLQLQQEQKELEEDQQANEEQTTNELLEKLITTIEEQQPTEEEQNSSMEVDKSIEEQLTLLNQNLVALTEEMPKEKIVVEGFYFIGLSVVIAFGVYMFWNQLSKW